MRKTFLILILIFLTGCGLNNAPTDNTQDSQKVATSAEETPSVTSQTLDASSSTPKEKKVMVAVLLPLDGQYKEVSNIILEAIHLSYSKESNPNIVLKVYSTKDGNNDVSEEATKQAIKDGAKAIMGPLFAEELKTVLETAKGSNIPVFTFSSDLSVMNSYDNVYSIGFTPETEVEKILDYSVQNKATNRVAAIIPENKYGEVVLASLKLALKERGMSLVRVVTYPTDEVNFTKYAESLVSKQDFDKYKREMAIYEKHKEENTLAEDEKMPSLEPDFDTLFLADNDGKRLVLLGTHIEYMDLDYKKLNIIGTRIWNFEKLGEEDIFVGGMYPDVLDITNNIVYSQYQTLYKKNQSPMAVAAYDVMKMISDLVSVDAGTDEVKAHLTAEDIINYKGVGVFGNFKLRKDGLIERDMVIKKVTKNGFEIIDTKSNYDYIKSLNYKDIDFNDNIDKQAENTASTAN